MLSLEGKIERLKIAGLLLATPCWEPFEEEI